MKISHDPASWRDTILTDIEIMIGGIALPALTAGESGRERRSKYERSSKSPCRCVANSGVELKDVVHKTNVVQNPPLAPRTKVGRDTSDESHSD